MDKTLERYIRQMVYPDIGEEGQRKLLASAVAIIGCGALGSSIANLLTRAGVGKIRIVDRDYIEPHNLQRQAIFDENDIAEGLPKAVAAADKLRAVNPQIEIEPVVADANPSTIMDHVSGMHLILDGTDNFETRYLINDASVKTHLPWIYGGAIGSEGITMTIIPYETACLRCISPLAPSPGTVPTCETAGVLGAVPALIASIQANEAIKLLVGQGTLNRGLIHVDLWRNTFQVLAASRRPECPTCGRGRFDYLEAQEGAQATALCGRDAVQVRVMPAVSVSLPRLAQRLQFAGKVRFNEYLLQFNAEGHQITVFPDGRAIIKGSGDESRARSLYSKYIGD